MSLVRLVQECTLRGLKLEVSGGALRWRGERGALTPALKADLQGYKEAVVNYLRQVADPRPDLKADGAYWGGLLARAYLLDGDKPMGLFGALHGLRCGGARLQVGPTGIHLATGNWGSDHRAVASNWLRPFASTLDGLLSEMSNAVLASPIRGGEGKATKEGMPGYERNAASPDAYGPARVVVNPIEVRHKP